MRFPVYKILIFSTFLTVVGFIADGDPKKLSLAMLFFEFFAMLLILFGIISTSYFIYTYVVRKLKVFRV